MSFINLISYSREPYWWKTAQIIMFHVPGHLCVVNTNPIYFFVSSLASKGLAVIEWDALETSAHYFSSKKWLPKLIQDKRSLTPTLESVQYLNLGPTFKLKYVFTYFLQLL